MNTGIFIIIVIVAICITVAFIKYCDVKDSENFYEAEAMVNDRKNFYEIRRKNRYLINAIKAGVPAEYVLAVLGEENEED